MPGSHSLSIRIHQSNASIVVTRDVSKTFDKVWHEELRYKIQTQYQLPPLTIKLLSTFLKQRTERIKVNGYEGPAFDLESGVPQVEKKPI